MSWQNEAACKGQDVNLFTSVDGDHPQGIGVDPETHDQLTFLNFNEARKFCNECPVATLCRESAKGRDSLYTLRGGVIHPKYQAAKPKPWPDGLFNSAPCPQGHVNRNRFNHCRDCIRIHKKSKADALRQSQESVSE